MFGSLISQIASMMARPFLCILAILYIYIASSVLLVASTPDSITKPNIVFVLVDDWGFADVGFRNPDIKTPNFDELANTGLILNRHYVFRYCSPSRASFLTGRWPHHAHQWNIDPPGVTLGLNINMTLLPAKLKQAGYSTHMVGKWHEGFFTEDYLPVNRGFDTSSGFLTGKEDHMNQIRDCATDFWKDKAFDSRNGTYDAYTYLKDLTSLLSSHDPSEPLFLYLPLHNVHDPFQAPDEWLNVYPIRSTCDRKRYVQAMISVADNLTGHLVELLKQKKMWSNTIMVVSADNGGAYNGGSNYPLKGSKMTFFEGGVRALAFANGGLLPEKVRGTKTEGFIHIADWYTTFCKLAGVDPSDSGRGKFPVDGLDVWPIITGENSSTPHEEIILGYEFNNTGAIIVGNYKLIVGAQSYTMHDDIQFPCIDGTRGTNCNPYCLYDIIKDPGEHQDLTNSHTSVLLDLQRRYRKYGDEPRDMQDQGYHDQTELPVDNNACKYMTSHGEYWQPWK